MWPSRSSRPAATAPRCSTRRVSPISSVCGWTVWSPKNSTFRESPIRPCCSRPPAASVYDRPAPSSWRIPKPASQQPARAGSGSSSVWTAPAEPVPNSARAEPTWSSAIWPTSRCAPSIAACPPYPMHWHPSANSPAWWGRAAQRSFSTSTAPCQRSSISLGQPPW